ncbi:YgiQ family radical SAM protein [Pseudothermotoga thermarum]|uniref:Radical SAM domain protein n=1 Tax=Pseudothermotoga thermarum DSM 5069 TaxID=688269 RepID=F7YTT3_9THEM|nr:YgiQ family radical SAM protein [Pseudothermotoga thermarum]AEH51378.1 Radical SAM domain protein [Pseudothermotoga thermarum DSM 5069]
MFLPTTREEMEKLGWKELDIIFVTGDAYVDHPSFGVALLGHYLVSKSYKVGIIAQPDWQSGKDITRLGRPRLFFGVTAGNVDSMVANYTASMKKRKSDEYTPGGVNNRRPDRAVIVYCNLIKRFFPKVPIIIGGIEASLRRFAHYDWWSDKIRKSILVDSKADLLVYGMGEKTLLQIAETLSKTEDIEACKSLRGIVYWTSKKPQEGIELPSFEEISINKEAYAKMAKMQLYLTDPMKNIVLYQKQDTRYVVQNPPQFPLEQEEFDKLYLLPFERKVHPYYEAQGHVPAIDMIQFSITAVRGCYGMCSFCALTHHQGTHVVSRSEESILEETKILTKHENFKGTITDVGGPTANMYGAFCKTRSEKGQCGKFCLHPNPCNLSLPDHDRFLSLLEKVKSVPGVKHVYVSSGLRHDLILHDKDYLNIIRRLVEFTPGQLKLAPEHAHPDVLRLMRKPPVELFLKFKKIFETEARKMGEKRYVIGYFIVAHPGESLKENNYLHDFIEKHLGYRPQQIQIFTPTPGTLSTAMYYTEMDPITGEKFHVEKSLKTRNQMKRNVLFTKEEEV